MTDTGTVTDAPAERDVLDTGAAGGRAIRGGVMRTAAYVGTLALGLVSVPLMTRHLGVVNYGYYVTVSSIVFIIGGFTEAGLTNLGIREYSALDGSERDRYLRSIAGLRFLLTATGVVLATLFAWSTGQPHDVVAGTAIAGVGLFIGLVQQTYAIPLSARLRFGWISVLDLVKQGVLVAVIVACVVAGAGLLPFFLANVASAAVVLAATLVLVRASTETSLMPLAERATWARVMRELVPYALAAIAGLIYFRLGVILLGYVSSDEQVGLYSTAFRITEVLAAAPFIIVSAGFPILARAARDDDERLRYGLQRLFDASLLLGGAVVVPLVVGARFAISAIAPISEFGGSVVVLQLQAVAIVFTFLVATFSFALLSLKRFRTLLWCNIVALVTAAVLTPALGPVLGAKGAAIATTSAEAVLSVAYVVGLARVRPDLVPRIGILPRLLVAAAAGLAMALLGLPVFVEAALAGLVYVGLAYALRAVPPELVNALLRRDPGHSGH